jgi:colanic acid biosynthesis glycosyl transferase WcaI
MPEVPLQALFVTQHYRPELVGSAPFCAELAEWLDGQGRQVTVLTGPPHYPDAGAFPGYRGGRRRREMLHGVLVERVRAKVSRRRTALSRILGESMFLLRGAAALATGRIERQSCVLSLCPSILSVALGVLARRHGGQHVALVHDIQSGLASGLGLVGSSQLTRLIRLCERVVLNRCDLVVVLSEEMRDQLRAIGVTAPIEIVPIWVDTAAIAPVSETAGRRLRLLYSGNLGRKQGLGQVIGLAEALQARGADIDIVLRGDGSERDAVQAGIAARRLTNMRVEELLPHEAFGRGLADGDIHLVPQNPAAAEFVVPSKIFSIMAAGRPFIATARPESPLGRLARRSGAFLCVPPNDARSFADTVMALARDGARRAALGGNGRNFVEQHYSKPKVLGALTGLIDGLYAAR